MRTLRVGSADVHLHDDGLTVTELHDGKTIPACHDGSAYQRNSAYELGYGDDVDLASREHEIAHSLLAKWLGLPESPTLRGVADRSYWPHWRKEEAAILGLQAYARAAGVSLETLAERESCNER